MLVVVSGEGPSDLGRCDGEDFRPGPMAWVIDKLTQARLDFSLVDCQCIRLIPEQELAHASRQLQPIKLPGKRSSRETGLYFKNARALAQKAKDRSTEAGDSRVIAILFRDADGTASAKRSEWVDKRNSMLNGFAFERFDTGVPMIPKPKSEAWLICALRDPPYQHCEALEQRSGNDHSPQSLKAELNSLLNGNVSAEEQAELVRDGTVDSLQIDMPSYNAFRKALDSALDKML
jgi:hypothetical protein